MAYKIFYIITICKNLPLQYHCFRHWEALKYVHHRFASILFSFGPQAVYVVHLVLQHQL